MDEPTKSTTDATSGSPSRTSPGASRDAAALPSSRSHTSLKALRTSSFFSAPPSTTPTAPPTATANVMANMFAPSSHSLLHPSLSAAQPQYPSAVPAMASSDLDVVKSTGKPFSSAVNSATPSRLLIRRLPLNTTDETLRLMTVFARDLVRGELLPPNQSADPGFRSAILEFTNLTAAQNAKAMLDGKPNFSNDGDMVVEVLASAPAQGSRYFGEGTRSNSLAYSPTGGPSTPSASITPSLAQTSRFANVFQSLEKTQQAPPPSLAPPHSMEPPTAESSARYHNLYSLTSSSGSHLSDRARNPGGNSGKTLINNDAADDETGELLNTLNFADNGVFAPPPFPPGLQQRRATAPAISLAHLPTGLGLNGAPSNNTPSSMPSFGHQTMTAVSAHGPSRLSPPALAGSGMPLGYNQSSFRTHAYPAVNPADQNPPCNTLYVGNLPLDTSEEELKAMFSKQRGYKRLCFRTKQNGPMCFVEFDDVSSATKALNELYGHMLHNSVKGGIRLSFSKNPLGVRSAPACYFGNGSAFAGPGNGFTTASGPPPGLTPPPGLGRNRGGYSSPIYGFLGRPNASNAWVMKYQPMTAGGPSMASTSPSSPFQTNGMARY